MDLNGIKVLEKGNKIILEDIRHFNIKHIFECGQCFRWTKEDDDSYTGVVKGKVINVRQDSNSVIIDNTSINDFENIWINYFDLQTDYGEIKRRINKDSIMDEAIKFGYGIRLLRQDVWETLISFIISANNRIPRIMSNIKKLSELFGEEIGIYDNTKYYSFPNAKDISRACEEELSLCKAGFRCKYIHETSGIIVNDTIDINSLITLDTSSARKKLMSFPGVGPKVADCVLLFSGTKFDVFPTDVWVKRVMETLYFDKEVDLNTIQQFAKEYFGHLAGFAQQYLFYYARENKIG